jgi:DNA (cytosine-5)-methyltransferase 1
MKVLDLFSGIGGFSFGLERAGMQTVAFCEVDPVCRKVLKKHWPDVPIFEDVKTLSAKDIGEPIDIIAGGFPCQDISLAGKGAGLAGARSGLWWEFHRLIQETKPKWVIAENVSALRNRGLDEVLRSLTEIGYDAEWHCIPASYVGAPHRRDRVWIVAYPNVHDGRHGRGAEPSNGQARLELRRGSQRQFESEPSQDVAHAFGQRLQRHTRNGKTSGQSQPYGSATKTSLRSREHTQGWWDAEPSVGRVADGVPNRVDRIKQLGNAVVPQIPELIGRAILAHEHSLA